MQWLWSGRVLRVRICRYRLRWIRRWMNRWISLAIFLVSLFKPAKELSVLLQGSHVHCKIRIQTPPNASSYAMLFNDSQEIDQKIAFARSPLCVLATLTKRIYSPSLSCIPYPRESTLPKYFPRCPTNILSLLSYHTQLPDFTISLIAFIFSLTSPRCHHACQK